MILKQKRFLDGSTSRRVLGFCIDIWSDHMLSIYKDGSDNELAQNSIFFDKYINSISEEPEDIEKIKEFFTKIDAFFECDYTSSIDSIQYLLNEIPNSPTQFQIYLSNNFLFIPKLFELFTPNSPYQEILLIFQMFHLFTTSDIFREREMNSEHVANNTCLHFCFDVIHKMFEESENNLNFFALALNCLTNFITKFNYSELDEAFFNDLRTIFLNDHEIALQCALLVEKLSDFVPFQQDYQYFFDFVHFVCVQPHPAYAYHLYSSIRNIIKRDYNLLRIPSDTDNFDCDTYWVFAFLLQSCNYDEACQNVVFDLCSVLPYQSISLILSFDKIRQNAFSALTNCESDIRLISIFRSLRHFMMVDPNNFSKYYFSFENDEHITPLLIRHAIESEYTVKFDVGYLLSFAIKQKPSFFIRGLVCHETPLMLTNLKEAIQSILDFDQPSLIQYLLHSIQTVCDQCNVMNILDQLFITFHEETDILEHIYQLKDNENEIISKLAIDILQYFEEFRNPE